MGVLQSPEDYRYINQDDLASATGEVIVYPRKRIIDASKVPNLYQRKIGACTSHGAVGVLMQRNYRLRGSQELLSPRFPYTMCKIEDGTDKAEQGTYCVLPFKMLVKYGCASDTVVPNDTALEFDAYIYNRDVRKMPAGAFESAAKNRIPGYVQVGKFSNVTENDIKKALNNPECDGIKFMIAVGNEFWTAKDGRTSWAKEDILPIRKCVNKVSNHDMWMIGYEIEDGTERMKIFFRNSWSTAWADNGDGWFYLDEHQIIEAWMPSEIPDALLAIVKSLPGQKDFTHTWDVSLDVGSKGEDVRALQIALKIVGTFPFNEPVTSYFGPITRSAVMKFQRQYKVASELDILAANGKCGPNTRAVLNKIFSRK